MSPTNWSRTVGTCAALLAAGAILCLSYPEAPARQKDKPKKHGLLIGVNVYKQKGNLPSLKYAENDAVEMAAALKKHGGFDSVRILSNTAGKDKEADAPTAANIRAELEKLARGKADADTVLVGFAGHGLQLEVRDPDKKGADKQYSYLCPHDADLADKMSYATGECASLVQVREIFDALKPCGAGVKLVLLDACRNELEAENVTRAADLDVDQLKVPRGIGAMFGCSRGQKARETAALGKGHGVFFHHVIRGLEGEAKDPKRGTVTWDRLVAYVKDEVAEYVEKEIGKGAEQKPASLGHGEGSAVLARFDLPKEKDGGAKPKDKKVDAEAANGWKDDITNSVGMKFKRIPAGKFWMGATKKQDDEASDDEGPRHEFEIKTEFWMGVTEVTQKQFEDVMGFNPSYFSHKGSQGKRHTKLDLDPAGGKDRLKDKDGNVLENTDDFPVENVSYEDVTDFLDALNKRAETNKNGWKYRLPYEAEWEYACRGSGSEYKKFHSGDTLSAKDANFADTKLERTEKVRSSAANAFGLHDMHGNVWEWCHDWEEVKYYSQGATRDPSGPRKGEFRIYRGGSWKDSAKSCRSAFRSRDEPVDRFNILGFRVVLVPAPQ